MKIILAYVGILAIAYSSAEEKSRDNVCRVVSKTTLTCADATVDDIPTTKNEDIEWLLFTKSNIKAFRKNNMKHFPSLTDIHAEKSGLEKIDEDAFSSSKNLDWVDVSNNQLTAISPNIFKNCPKISYFNVSGNPGLVIPEHAPFLKAQSLQWLLLQQSNIKTLYVETFKDLPSLKVLSLSENELTELPPGIFSHLNNLYSLDLSKNKFALLSPALFEPLQYISLYMGGNPWDCNCSLQPLIQYSKTRRLKDEVRCSKPDNKKWQEVIYSNCPAPIEVI